jgi:hypothetical protein
MPEAAAKRAFVQQTSSGSLIFFKDVRLEMERNQP